MAVKIGTNGSDYLLGTDDNDDLFGGIGNDYLLGGFGNDRLYGGSEVDVLLGGDGNDILDGGTGNDVMRGGTGNDTYYVDSQFDTFEERPGEGNDTIFSSISIRRADHIENIFLTGTADINIEADSIDNVLVGNSGRNFIIANGGSDIIDGGGGADILSGGASSDLFIFRKGEANGDYILDFEGYGKYYGDRIQFIGYSEEATFTRLSGDIYQVVDGTSVETLRISGPDPVHPSDYTFV